MKRLLQKLGVFAMLIGLVVDLVAFVHIFGVEIVLSPGPISTSLRDSPVSLKSLTCIEAITFLIWSYSSIVLIIVMKRLTRVPPFIPLILSTVPGLMLMVWLWGFEYIAEWLYVFFLPTVGFASMSWFAASMVHSAYNRALMVISLIAVGLTILWFRANLTWPFPLVIVSAAISCLVGNGLGYNISEQVLNPIIWITHGIKAFERL